MSAMGDIATEIELRWVGELGDEVLLHVDGVHTAIHDQHSGEWCLVGQGSLADGEWFPTLEELVRHVMSL